MPRLLPVLRAAAGAVAIVVLAGAACTDRGLSRTDARLSVNGDTEVAGPGRSFKAVHGSRRLHSGDRVRVHAGSADIALASGGRLELRALLGDPRGAQDTIVRMGSEPFLQAGELITEPDTHPLVVGTDEGRITVADGITRLSRTLALTVTAYRGSSSIDSPGGSPLTVRAPRQATIPARGVVPDRAVAASYNPADAWDRRFLGAAIELGYQLQRDSVGFAAQLPPGEGRTPGFFRLIYPGLERESSLDTLLRPDLGPGENLVGAAIALAAKGGSFPERWVEVFGFRNPDQGNVDCTSPASACVNWGLVAMDQGVTDQDGLGSTIDVAIGRAPKRFTATAESPQPAAAPPVGAAPSAGSVPSSSATAGRGSSGQASGGQSAGGQATGRGSGAAQPSTGAGTSSPGAPSASPAAGAPSSGSTPAPSSPPPAAGGSQPSQPAPSGGILDQVLDPLLEIVNGVLGTGAGR
jgi:hypothetical protein